VPFYKKTQGIPGSFSLGTFTSNSYIMQ